MFFGMSHVTSSTEAFRTMAQRYWDVDVAQMKSIMMTARENGTIVTQDIRADGWYVQWAHLQAKFLRRHAQTFRLQHPEPGHHAVLAHFDAIDGIYRCTNCMWELEHIWTLEPNENSCCETCHAPYTVPELMIADDAADCSATEDEDEVDEQGQDQESAGQESSDEEDIGSLIDFIDDAEQVIELDEEGARPEVKDIVHEESDIHSASDSDDFTASDGESAHTTDDGPEDDEIEAMDIDDTTEAETPIESNSDSDDYESYLNEIRTTCAPTLLNTARLP